MILKAELLAPAWRQRRGGQCSALGITQGQEHRHDALHMSRKADVLLNEDAGA